MVEKKEEEKKSGMWRVVTEVIIPTLITSLLTSVLAFIGTYFMLEQGSVNVSGSVPIDNQFSTVISVENFKKTSLSELALCIDEKINIFNVYSEKDLEMYGQYLNFPKIPPKSIMSIIVYSDKEICSTDVYVDSPDKIAIYAGLMESPSWISVWKQIKPMVLAVSLGVFIALCLQEHLNQKLQRKIENAKDDCDRKLENEKDDFNRKTEELEKELSQRIEESKELEEEVSKTNNKHLELEEKVREANKRCSELKVYYVQRISAQKKELAFWKDTIRKFIYLNSKNIDEAEKLFEAVISTLKTYAARDQVYENFDEIQYIAEQIAKDKKKQEPDEE